MTAQATARRSFGSDTITDGVRVIVAPRYLADQAGADDDEAPYVFGYRIRIINESAVPCRLVSRHWVILDADGELSEVKGEGVIGKQPHLAPGQQFEYTSFCPLPTAWGTMEGSYRFHADDGRAFDVRIGRFYLVADQEPARR